MKTRWIAALAALTLWIIPAKAQQLIFPVGGVVTVDASPGKAPYEVFVNAVVTSVVFTNPTPGQILTVMFLQDATGHAVTFGGNILNACTVSATANALTSCQFQYDARTVQWTGLGGGGGGGISAIPGVIDATAAKYGLKDDGQTVTDATFTAGQNTISCATTNDCNFTAADNGKICFGTNMTSDVSAITGLSTLPQGVLTVTGAQTATCSGGNWPTGTAAGTARFVWGSDDSTALSSAWTDAVASCKTLQLPSGYMLVQSGQFNTNSTGDKCVPFKGGGQGGFGVNGWGSQATFLVPTPNFSAASCTGTSSADTCFFGSTAIQVQRVAIYGAGQAAIGAGFNGKYAAVATGSDALVTAVNNYWYDVAVLSWGTTTAGFTGFQVRNTSNALFDGLHVDGGGSINCKFSPGSGPLATATFIGAICGVANVNALVLDTGGYVYSFGGTYGWIPSTASSNAMLISGASARFYSSGDNFPFQCGTVTTDFYISTSATNAIVSLDGDIVACGTTTIDGIQVAGAGSTLLLHNTIIQANNGATSKALHILAGTSVLSTGGNNISSTAGSSVTNAGSFTPESGDIFTGTITNTGSIFGTNSAAGTACATGNFALTSGWGTSAVSSVAANGSIQGCHVTITGAAGAAGPVLTWTYPASPLVAPASCHLIGTTASLPTVQAGVPGATTVAFTFTGTPVAVTYQFDVGCP